MLHRGSKPRAGAPDFCPQTALACTPKTLRTGIKDRGKKSQRRDSSNKMFFFGRVAKRQAQRFHPKLDLQKPGFPSVLGTVSFRMFRFRDSFKIKGSLHVLWCQMWQLPRWRCDPDELCGLDSLDTFDEGTAVRTAVRTETDVTNSKHSKNCENCAPAEAVQATSPLQSMSRKRTARRNGQ